jgi:hypothetical protein
MAWYLSCFTDGNPKKYSFTPYGRLGNVQGFVTGDGFDSDAWDVYKGKDDKVAEGIANIVNHLDITNKRKFTRLMP